MNYMRMSPKPEPRSPRERNSSRSCSSFFRPILPARHQYRSIIKTRRSAEKLCFTSDTPLQALGAETKLFKFPGRGRSFSTDNNMRFPSRQKAQPGSLELSRLLSLPKDVLARVSSLNHRIKGGSLNKRGRHRFASFFTQSICCLSLVQAKLSELSS